MHCYYFFEPFAANFCFRFLTAFGILCFRRSRACSFTCFLCCYTRYECVNTTKQGTTFLNALSCPCFSSSSESSSDSVVLLVCVVEDVSDESESATRGREDDVEARTVTLLSAMDNPVNFSYKI